MYWFHTTDVRHRVKREIQQKNPLLAPGHWYYSLFQKKRTFNAEFFSGPLVEGGPKIHMVDYVNGSSIHAQFFLLENLQLF